jgi:hypothetical protein
MSLEIVIILGVVVLLVLGLQYFNNKKLNLLRALSKLELKAPHQFKANTPAKFSGRVEQYQEPLKAPLSKRACVAYRFKVEQYVKVGKNEYWRTLVETSEIRPFVVTCKTDTLLVIPKKTPKNYESYFVSEKTLSSGILEDFKPELKYMLLREGINLEKILIKSKTLRYTERILELGEKVVVGGVVKQTILEKPIEGYKYSKIATLTGSEAKKMIITNHKKALNDKGKT